MTVPRDPDPTPSEPAPSGPRPSAWAVRMTRAGWFVALAHAAFAGAAWVRATHAGARLPDVVGLGFLALSTLLAAAAAGAAFAVRRRARLRALALVAGFGLLAPQLSLLQRFGEATDRYEVALSSVPAPSDDGSITVSLALCDPLQPHGFARLSVVRRGDGRTFGTMLPLRRDPRDAWSWGQPWIRATALGQERYWLAVAVVVARPGPQHFLLELAGDRATVRAVENGVTYEDGRAQWDCAVWNPKDESGPPGPWLDDGALLPPARTCRIAALARTCGADAVAATLRRPQFAADAAGLPECLARRAAAGDEAAWDARIALALEDRDTGRAVRLADEARTAAERRSDACAAARAAARRLAVGRRINDTPTIREAADALVAARREHPECTAEGPAGAEFGKPPAVLAWEVAVIERRWGMVDASCARVTGLDLATLDAAARAEAERWLAVCRARAG